MSTLLDAAQQMADAQRAKATDERRAHDKERARLQDLLDRMSGPVIEALKKIDGHSTKYGTFKVEFEKGGMPYNVIAYLRCGNRIVAWFKAAIVHGSFDGSDDCRDIPITYLQVWARFYGPNAHNRDDHDRGWDISETRWYHNGGVQESCDTLEAMPKFFAAMTMQLSLWL